MLGLANTCYLGGRDVSASRDTGRVPRRWPCLPTSTGFPATALYAVLLSDPHTTAPPDILTPTSLVNSHQPGRDDRSWPQTLRNLSFRSLWLGFSTYIRRTQFRAKDLLQGINEFLVQFFTQALEMTTGEDDDLFGMRREPCGDGVQRLLEKQIPSVVQM